MIRFGSTAVAFALLTLVVSCKGEGKTGENGGKGRAVETSAPRGELLVFAAASLTDVFSVLAEDFEREYPGVKVSLNFAGSQSLRTQIENGAQPQVFASANAQHMETLRSKKLVGEPAAFARNEMVIVVPAGNPSKIESLADLPKAERLVLAGEAVPAGRYAEKVLENARASLGADFAERVKKKLVSRENHVRQSLQKVALGEADAAMVYATDAASARAKVEVVRISPPHNVVATYPIAVVTGSPRAALGQLFVDFVRSEAGGEKLEEFGFGTPGSKGDGQ